MSQRDKAMKDLQAVVSKCPDKERNCFATDPFAYGIFIVGADEDPAYDMQFKRAGIAAIKAAQAGDNLVESEFTTSTYKTTSKTVPFDTNEPILDAVAVGGHTQGIIDLAARSDSISDMTYRIASCAYNCALQQEGNCPIFEDFKEEN